MVSAVVLTKNEENNIERCLRSLEWCDEIIILDDYSEDATIEKIKSLNRKNISIYKHHLNDNFAEQRNKGLQKASNEWVFFVDADEVVSPSLQFEIVSRISTSIENISGYYVRRVDTLWGKPINYGEAARVRLLRLAKKETGKWKNSVHEVWDIHGNIAELDNPLIHFPHQTITLFLKEINYYTTIRAKELFKQRKKTSGFSIVFYPIAKFFYNYILRFGFLDGIRGILVATLMSFHSFLVRTKLWLLWEAKR